MQLAVSDSSRRNFLRGKISATPLPIRPPWALDEGEFVASCNRCDQCLPACKPGIIKRGDGGFPEIDFSAGGCTFCGDCVKACDSRALVMSETPWRLKASVKTNCLSYNGVVCRSCGDLCEQEAIRFQLKTGGRAIPRIDQNLCNGCGQCRSICPTQSVSITPLSEEAS